MPFLLKRFVPFVLIALTLLPTSPAADADGSPTVADTRERFFGAVQAIYNPQRAAEAGVQWERLIFPWSLIQKNGPNTWQDGYFSDQQIRDEIARGIQVVGLAIYTPQWATSTPQKPGTTNVPKNLYLPFDDPQNYWGQFMFKLAQRYKGQIDTWVIWNEPDMYSDAILYNWDGSISDLFQLVKVANQAVKKANPDAKIALPGMTYWWDKESGRPLYLARFLEAASKDPTSAANGNYFDIVVLHQYSNPLNTFAAVKTMQRAMAVYGIQRPIWVGESNVPPDDDPGNAITPVLHATMDQQASYIIQAFALARAAGVDRMSIYKMVDEQPEGPGELYGLVRNNGSPRPAFTAFQTAVRYMSTPASAVYSWDGASDPPTESQITHLLQSNDHQTQWIWPAAVNWVTMERGPERVTVAWNASSKIVTAHLPATAKSAMVVDKFGKDTGQVIAQNGTYNLDLYPTNNNTDPRDPTAYLVGGDPRILVEKVAPLPTAVDATVEVVWAKNATSANITGALLQPNSLQAVPCRWQPNVRLFASIDGGPAVLVRSGDVRLLTQDGLRYPVWDFNDVDISPSIQGKSIDFWLDVDGVATHATRWTYSTAPPVTPTPIPIPTPSDSATNTPDQTPGTDADSAADLATPANQQLSVGERAIRAETEADLRPPTRAILDALRRVVPLMRARDGADDVHEKRPNDIVTGTDVLVQATLQQALNAFDPGIAFLGEEGDTSADVVQAARRWLVDPICGTSNYAVGLPLFASNVALVEDGLLMASGVADGGTGELFVAERDRGAWRASAAGGLDPIRVRPDNLLVSVDPDNRGGTGWRDFSNRFAIEAIARRRWDVRALSSTLALLYLATGRLGAAVYASLGDPLHFAAGLLLASEAGALVTDPAGQPFQLESPIVLAAASPSLHAELRQLAERLYREAIEDAGSPRM